MMGLCSPPGNLSTRRTNWRYRRSRAVDVSALIISMTGTVPRQSHNLANKGKSCVRHFSWDVSIFRCIGILSIHAFSKPAHERLHTLYRAPPNDTRETVCFEMSVGYVVKNVHHPDRRSSAGVRTTRACIAAQARPDEARHAVIQVEQNGVTSTNFYKREGVRNPRNRPRQRGGQTRLRIERNTWRQNEAGGLERMRGLSARAKITDLEGGFEKSET